MRKAVLAAMAAVLLCGFQDADAPRRWRPGDRCVLFAMNQAGTDVSVPWVLNGLFAWDACEKALTAHDQTGLNLLKQRGQLIEVASGTKAQVIEFHKAYNFRDESKRDAWEVRLLDGDHAGKSGWVLESEMRHTITVFGDGITAGPGPEGYGKAILESDRKLTKEINEVVGDELDTVKGASKRNRRLLLNRNRRITAKLKEICFDYERSLDDVVDIFEYAVDHGWLPRTVPAKAAPKSKAPTNRAAGLLRISKALETTNPAAAIKSYQEIVAKYPDSPEAKSAKDRLAKLKP